MGGKIKQAKKKSLHANTRRLSTNLELKTPNKPNNATNASVMSYRTKLWRSSLLRRKIPLFPGKESPCLVKLIK